jgi:hypothetical protein
MANAIKALLQMTSVSLQPVPSLETFHSTRGGRKDFSPSTIRPHSTG